MPLFGSGRDSRFIRSISKEIINDIVGIEVGIYKISLDDTRTNIYNESLKKFYYSPIKIACLVENGDKTSSGDESFIDFTRTIVFYFLRDQLMEKNIPLEEGDIIEWDRQYFEIDNLSSTNYWMNRNPDTYMKYNSGETTLYGYNTTVKAETHLTKLSTINIEDFRIPVSRTEDDYLRDA